MLDGMQKHIVRGLMAGLCLLWLVFGIIMLDKNILLGILMMANGLCFGFFAFVCKAKSRLLKWLIYVFVGANIILTLTDQMGLYDWIVLVLYIILIAFMIIDDTGK